MTDLTPADIQASREDAEAIAYERRMRRRHNRRANLYPKLIFMVGIVVVYIHFIWHPY
jgi:pilus assembly protein TadC